MTQAPVRANVVFQIVSHPNSRIGTQKRNADVKVYKEVVRTATVTKISEGWGSVGAHQSSSPAEISSAANQQRPWIPPDETRIFFDKGIFDRNEGHDELVRASRRVKTKTKKTFFLQFGRYPRQKMPSSHNEVVGHYLGGFNGVNCWTAREEVI
jgi:hypothetical protein